VPAAGLSAAIADLRRHAAAGRIAGANVTVPHKQAVLALVDTADAVAQGCGAVNTLCIDRSADGSTLLRGLNTDVAGLQRALAESGVALAGSRVVILGAGGMARAAVAAAFAAGAALVRVAARSLPRAQDLLDALAARWPGSLPQLACAAWDDAENWLADTDVLVHATPLGLHAGDALPCSLAQAQPALFVQDCVYGRDDTPLVRAARARGLRAADGRGPLVHQGAAALTAWTGCVAPVDVMRRSLEFEPR
jgi:shikimate dehydrogenase